MDTTYGVLCLIPPIVAIGLALWTKQTIFSLFIAVWLGSTMMNGFNPLVGFVKIISDYMIPSLSGNASLIILVTLSGGMIAMLRNTGAAEAFATKVTKVINTAKKGQIVTCLSAFIFSYTEPCLMLGTIMRPVTDMVRISRAKLAYILDSMGCNLAALSPISSYGPFITGLIAAELLASGVEGNEWGIWLNMLPFNLYGVFAMISVLIVAAFGLNFGPMYKEEKRARETGKLLDDGVQPLVPEVKNELPADYKLTMWNFIIPIVCLFGSLFATIFWSGDLVNNGLVGCFRSANITLAICIAFMGGALGAGIHGCKHQALQRDQGVRYLCQRYGRTDLGSLYSGVRMVLGLYRQGYGDQRVSDPYCGELPDSRHGSGFGIPVWRTHFVLDRFLLGRVVYYDAHCFPDGHRL